MHPDLDAIQSFYERYPHPDPMAEIPPGIFTGEQAPESSPAWFFHVYWPRRHYRDDLDILIAGCGTRQAAVYGAGLPRARIVAIDVSAAALAHSVALCTRHAIANVEHRQIALEQIDRMGETFDLIISTGVLHHTASPASGLAALRHALRVDGSMSLMLYGKYGRSGIYLVQELLRRLGVTADTADEADFETIRKLVRSLPSEHPLAARLASVAPELPLRSGVTDLFLNPRDRAYAVPDIYALLAECDLVLQEWFSHSQYEPRCLGLSDSPFIERLSRLPVAERYAIGELYTTRIDRHRFVACRSDRPPATYGLSLEAADWRSLIPIKSRDIRIDQTDARPGRTPWVWLPHHRQDGIRIDFDGSEAALFNRIDGQRTIDAIHERPESAPDAARAFWQRLYQHDLVWFRAEPSHRTGA